MYNQQLNYNSYYYRKFNDYQVIRVEPIIYRYGKAAISPFNSKSKVSLTRDKDIVYLGKYKCISLRFTVDGKLCIAA